MVGSETSYRIEVPATAAIQGLDRRRHGRRGGDEQRRGLRTGVRQVTLANLSGHVRATT
jgi:hypothetical protein